MTISTDSYILGSSPTDTNNFLLDTDGAGALRIRRRSDGSGGTLISFSPSGAPSIPGLTVTQANQNTLPGTGVVMSYTHGLGAVPASAELEIVCLTADQGFAVGDVVTPFTQSGASFVNPFSVRKNATVVSATTGSVVSWQILNATSGASVVPTAANWAWRFKVRIE